MPCNVPAGDQRCQAGPTSSACANRHAIWLNLMDVTGEIRQGLRQQWETVLTEEEVCQIERYFGEEQRVTAALSFALQKCVLAHHLWCFPRDVVIKRPRSKKPYCPDLDGDFNVSHDQGHFGIVWSSYPSVQVGVDLMGLKLRPRHATVADQMKAIGIQQLNSHEADWIAHGSDEFQKLFRFYFVWTAKESIVKAIGCGIVVNLKCIQLVFSEELLKCRMEPFLGRRFTVCPAVRVRLTKPEKDIFGEHISDDTIRLRHYIAAGGDHISAVVVSICLISSDPVEFPEVTFSSVDDLIQACSGQHPFRWQGPNPTEASQFDDLVRGQSRYQKTGS